ncbi:RND efflux system, membrane fusion protein [Olavius algarvensis associated proteobacterium Delta 3]|nr:RND efflux system, membrane fusion protein [Olavius algarvensis associated proteobacterium Delta 3]CAB5116750.1 RND efflux system, membrane fusion protein [Olavius algarvensis associated proteobacterium Delta 3]
MHGTNLFKIGCLLGMVALLIGCGKKAEQAQAPPPPEVSVVTIEAQEVLVPIEFVGEILGAQDIAIRARVEGFLEGIHFEEGGDVEAGQLLYTIESQPYEADVAAFMSRVAEAKTMLAKATSDLNRIRPLAKAKAVSESDLDSAVAEYEAAEASVQAAEANLRASKINLSYTRVKAPITGIIGKTHAKVGDFVGRSPNPVILNTVSNIETVRVQFYLTENQFLQVARYIQELEKEKQGEVDPQKAKPSTLKMYLSDGSLYPETGTFDFIDRGIDPTTGSILIQVSFPNPEELLRPGQFARITTYSETIESGILVPQRCVSDLQGIQRVFVVGNDNKVEERRIDRGPQIGNRFLIREGLKAGERIVFEGLQKVADGSVVTPKAVTPPTSETETS